MATSVDISPAVGHPVMATQLGIGATPGYDAIDLRRLASQGLQSGVHDALGWQVGEATPNSLNVLVNANVGVATVEGTSILRQGRYVVAPHSGIITLTLTAAHATLPRIDQIILRVYDTTHDGSGLNKASAEVLTGTATSGATLDNRTGAAVLPANAIRLADILVGQTVTTIANAVIRDRRPWANGFTYRAVKTSGDLTPGTGPAEFGSGTFKFRAECSGNPVLITFFATIFQSSTDNSVQIGPWIDGAPPDGATQSGQQKAQVIDTATGLTGGPVNPTFMLLPSAGSHLISMWQIHTNAVTIFANANQPAILFVREMIPGLGMFNGAT